MTFASGQAPSPRERELVAAERHQQRLASIERTSSFLRACRIMGVPAVGQPSPTLKRLWARMTGDREDAA